MLNNSLEFVVPTFIFLAGHVSSSSQKTNGVFYIQTPIKSILELLKSLHKPYNFFLGNIFWFSCYPYHIRLFMLFKTFSLANDNHGLTKIMRACININVCRCICYNSHLLVFQCACIHVLTMWTHTYSLAYPYVWTHVYDTLCTLFCTCFLVWILYACIHVYMKMFTLIICFLCQMNYVFIVSYTWHCSCSFIVFD